jgi:hypothetical protein
MWITDMRKSQDPPIMIKDVVPVIRNIFPRYDAQLHSKVERPEQYGIKLCKEAEDAIRAHFLIYPIKPSKPHSHDNRTKPCRIYGRLEKGLYSRLQTALKADGYASTQDWMHDAVVEYLKSKEPESKKEAQ